MASTSSRYKTTSESTPSHHRTMEETRRFWSHAKQIAQASRYGHLRYPILFDETDLARLRDPDQIEDPGSQLTSSPSGSYVTAASQLTLEHTRNPRRWQWRNYLGSKKSGFGYFVSFNGRHVMLDLGDAYYLAVPRHAFCFRDQMYLQYIEDDTRMEDVETECDATDDEITDERSEDADDEMEDNTNSDERHGADGMKRVRDESYNARRDFERARI
jgi:hypothetical protein